MEEDTATSVKLNFTAPADVECNVCIGRKRKKAKQSCLECCASFCKTHIDLHNILHVGKRCKLVATGRLQETLCPNHNKVIEAFCQTDQKCICRLCIMDEHRTHDFISINYKVAEKKIKLVKMQKETTELIQTWEKEEQNLKQAIEAYKTSAKEAVERNSREFTQLIQSMERRQSAVKELIVAQEEATVKQVKERLERLKWEITDLKKKDAELQHLKRLFQADDNVHFLQNVSLVSHLTKSIQIPALLVQPHSLFQLATKAVSDLIKQLNIICQWRFMTISQRVKSTGIVSSSQPRTHQELLKYASKLTLDLNTVHKYISLSNKNTVLTAVNMSVDYPNHPNRFERRVQALCSEGLQGAPQYWEVECGVNGSWVCIAVSYKGICRKGKTAPLFGRCKSSWALRNFGGLYEYWHDNKSRLLQEKSSLGSRIGIYLDHGAGILAFYNVASNISLIIKVQTKFTEPVYAGFGLIGTGSQIKLCDLNAKK
ncbi:tripartite motif-containing protein 16-like [Trichomycterus rosablanca]|uniref:tripartite motif-containing protein 16-like n=1 Tax=Trichomycterus rosablanca TaxID=2290929 RepID=UPI002F35BE3F